MQKLLCLLSGLLIATTAPGCGDSATNGVDLDASTDGSTDSSSDGTTGLNACVKAGGFCLTGATCPSGYRRDDGALSCPAGPGLGIANQPCCVPEVKAARPTDYAQSCSVDGDCELVDDSGDACCPGCLGGAIAKSDDAKYKADLAKFRATCKSTTPCPPRSCPMYVAMCKSGKCEAVPCAPTCPGADAGADASEGG